MRSFLVSFGGLGVLSVFGAAWTGCGDNLTGTCVDTSTCPCPEGTTGQLDDAGVNHCIDSEAGADAIAEGGSEGGTMDGGSDAPADAPMEATISCDAATAIVCGTQCVDSTKPENCGACMHTCPAPTSGHGSATCSAPNTCGIACSSGFHTCNGDCLPDTNEPSADPCVVTDALGVFVSPSGSDTGACGTKASPCATIGKGLTVAKAANKRTYVCEGTYNEKLVVDSSLDGVKVFGGFACSNWAYDVMKKPLVAPSTAGYSLAISGLTTGVSFTDFQFQSANATSAGASSIAVFVNGSSNVAFKRVVITAGDAQDGAAGVLSSFTYPSATTLRGNAGSGGTGGPANLVTCPGGLTTTGGKGGDSPASSGDPGLPSLGGGAGGTSAACVGTGGGGAFGTAAGNAANGGGAASLGALTSGGWTPAAGAQGTNGGPGQGGGGGGGVTPGGGGGGGAGGCGGAGGGGGGGGASVAIVSMNSAITLTTCTLTSKRGGTGGAGVSGQPGQSSGGNGGIPDPSGGCLGGRGGAGGLGGAGGGGAGGVSAGVLYKGTAPTLDSQTTSSFVQGQKGTKGTGGVPTTNDGIDGANGVTLVVP